MLEQLTEVKVASCYAYAPCGVGPLCEALRQICGYLKKAHWRRLVRCAVQVWRENVTDGIF